MINESNFDVMKRMCSFFFVAVFCAVILPNIVFVAEASASTGGISQVLCNVLGQLQGGIGKGIATIAVIVLGVGLFLGKFSWPLAVATAIGIGMIFGASSIVTWVSAGNASTSDGAACS